MIELARVTAIETRGTGSGELMMIVSCRAGTESGARWSASGRATTVRNDGPPRAGNGADGLT